MNFFLEQSLEYARQRCYLDDLYKVYPTMPNTILNIESSKHKTKNCLLPRKSHLQTNKMFKKWIETGVLGIIPVSLSEFISTEKDAVLKANDKEMKHFAESRLNYHHKKCLDFIGRFSGKYIIGKVRYLTSSYDRHENAKLNDALATITSEADAIKVAILDGVCYIPGKNNMIATITSERYRECNIMSALVLRHFLYSL